MSDDSQPRPTSTRLERARRDARVMALFIGGATYRDIGERLGMSHTNVDKVVRREMAKAAKRRDALADQALGVFIERTEALFKAHYPNALRGDYKSSVICDRVLARQARLYGINGLDLGGSGAEAPEPDDDGPLTDDDESASEVTDLDDYRRRAYGIGP